MLEQHENNSLIVRLRGFSLHYSRDWWAQVNAGSNIAVHCSGKLDCVNYFCSILDDWRTMYIRNLVCLFGLDS